MNDKQYKRFYFISLAVLLLLSAYPLINGTRMAWLSIQNGGIEPAQYAKYVIPYAAMCLSLVLFAAAQPLYFKIKRFSFLVGIAVTYGIFFGAEQFFEHIQVHTAGMSLVNAGLLSIVDPSQIVTLPTSSVDAWQASLCMISPFTMGQSVTFASQDRFYYVMANDSYKLHYYLISAILIAMVCYLVYGLGKMFRSGDMTKKRRLFLQGISTMALLSLCVFANTTAFFRQAGAIQTPLASTLTCLFFLTLGAGVGNYIGSFFIGRSKRLGLLIPVLAAIMACTIMYMGEAVMMGGNLYRFGTGWFWSGLPGISLAPIDILLIMLCGFVTWLMVGITRNREGWPGKWTVFIASAVCAVVVACGIVIPITAPKGENDILGCYVFDECVYMNPLSSFMAIKGHMPYVYGLSEDTLVIANTETGHIEIFEARYEKTPVPDDEFSSKADLIFNTFPDLSQRKDRYLLAVCQNEYLKYGIYQIDDEIWLVKLSNGRLWSIYRLVKTENTTINDLSHALERRTSAPAATGQMTIKDVYALSRKGNELIFDDFESFAGTAVGSDFTIMRYDVEGGCVVLLHCDTPEAKPNYIRLSKQGYDPFDESLTVDIRNGYNAVAAYLDPLHSLMRLQIEDKNVGIDAFDALDLIYEYGGYSYYLNSIRSSPIMLTFENGERMELKQALAERRLIVEDAVANGLCDVFTYPYNNPFGGEFTISHHKYTFSLDGEDIYPSISFMYTVFEDDYATYFYTRELIDIFEQLDKKEQAEKLRDIANTNNLPVIADQTYISEKGLRDAGINVTIDWMFSSHTPVSFWTSAQ